MESEAEVRAARCYRGADTARMSALAVARETALSALGARDHHEVRRFSVHGAAHGRSSSARTKGAQSARCEGRTPKVGAGGVARVAQ